MGRLKTTNALVLKTYDIGDADRFCVFLTESEGRVMVVAKGARKPQSKLSGALQSFQSLRVDLAEHSSGFYLRSAECLASYDHIRQDLQRFLLASKGAELLLHFLHDTEPQSSIFVLACDFFRECDRSFHDLLFPTFQLMLLKELGLLPSFEEGLRHAEQAPRRASTPFVLRTHSAQHDVSGAVSKHLARRGEFSSSLCSYLVSTDSLADRLTIDLSQNDQRELQVLCDELLHDHLSFPMKSNAVLSAVS